MAKTNTKRTSSHVSRLREQGLKNPIRKLLLQGRSVRDTARLLKISTVRVYEYANQHNLPTNKPIVPGSSYEKQVHQHLFSNRYPLRVLATLLRTSYPYLLSIKKKAKPSRTIRVSPS